MNPRMDGGRFAVEMREAVGGLRISCGSFFEGQKSRIVRLVFCAIDEVWFEPVAEFVDQLDIIALPDCVS
jgi:hypothetical protein